MSIKTSNDTFPIDTHVTMHMAENIRLRKFVYARECLRSLIGIVHRRAFISSHVCVCLKNRGSTRFEGEGVFSNIPVKRVFLEFLSSVQRYRSNRPNRLIFLPKYRFHSRVDLLISNIRLV